MPHLPDLEDIVSSNPDVDAKQLQEGRDLLRRLRQAGARGARYKLVPPRAGHRVGAGEECENDPRTVHLRRRR